MRSRLYETENFGEKWLGIYRERHEKDLSTENFGLQYAFRKPRIEGELGRKEEGIIVRLMMPCRQKNGGRWETRTLDLIRVKDAF